MLSKNLKYWDHIFELSLSETAMLIAGVDPNSEIFSTEERSQVLVYQRAISEAVQRANSFAWEYSKELDRLLLKSKENAVEINEMSLTPDIWEVRGRIANCLPTVEIRQSVSAVLADPTNVPILLAIDPWYTATVYGGDFKTWLAGAGIESAYRFVDRQKITVTSREANWDSSQGRAQQGEEIVVSVESANKFNDETKASEKPLSTVERNVLLTIVAALCLELKIDYKRHAKAAGLVKDLVVGIGANVGETTIEGHLKRIPDALEARMK